MTEKPPLGVQGHERSVRELLQGKKYTIDYYQRDYKWGKEHIATLLEDLANKFATYYKPGHDREKVAGYGNYFLGSIVVNQRDGKSYLIDGQQRLTSLTLLLIYLHHLAQNVAADGITAVQSLIFSQAYGKKSFNIDIEERTECMRALFDGQPFDASGKPESVRNLMERYRDIEENFPDDLENGALPYFIDWLIERVVLVEIVAFSEEDAYTIFETMNDRGLSLSPTDMLKGYLLTHVDSADQRERLENLWRESLHQLRSMPAAGREEDAAFFRAWLRAKYAKTIRERKRNATNQDFERIGTPFHKWVRDEHERIPVTKSTEYRDFIERQFAFFCGEYQIILDASTTFRPEFEYIYYNASNYFTLQPPLLLAPLRPEDDQDTVSRKLRLVSGWIDIFIARRVWNFRTLGYSSIVYTMFNLIKEIRDKSVPELAEILRRRIDEVEPFASNDRLRVHQQNQYYVHRLLARMTYHVERECGVESSYVTYIDPTIKKPFEIEHVWADHADQHRDEFPDQVAFAEWRSRIGGLILLPRGYNQSFADAPYETKIEHYYAQNLLARSLHPRCYQNNPAFMGYVQRSELAFQPHTQFKRADLDQRQMLYTKLAEQIWSPARFDAEVR